MKNKKNMLIKRLLLVIFTLTIVMSVAAPIATNSTVVAAQKKKASKKKGKKKKLTVENIKASYMVFDQNAGRVIASNEENRRVFPASTTKVLSVITLIDRMREVNIPLNSYVRVTKKMLKSVPGGSKCAYLYRKKWYRYKDLLGLVMVASAADAVKVLEKSVFGTQKRFVKAMNKKAQMIGMKNSYFDNPIGLDKSNGYTKIHTTASDMTRLALYATSNYKLVNHFAKKKKIKIKDRSGKYVHIQRSTNQFYSFVKYNKKKYKVVGIKTGFTVPAGCTLLTRAVGKSPQNKGKTLVVAVFFVKGNENVYQDTKLLLDRYM